MTYTATIKDHGEEKGAYRFQVLVKPDDSTLTTGHWFASIQQAMSEISRQMIHAYTYGNTI